MKKFVLHLSMTINTLDIIRHNNNNEEYFITEYLIQILMVIVHCQK